MTRLRLRTRLALTYGAVFMVAGIGVVALIVALAQQSVDRANRGNAPARNELAKTIQAVLGAERSSPGATKSVPPDAVQKAQDKGTVQKLLNANALYSTATGSDAQHHLIIWSALAAGVLLPAAAGAGWLLARRSLQPLHEVTDSVRKVSGSSLSERVAMVGPPDEITTLASTFDDMMDRLEHAFDAQQRFVANASHELRTPLAVAGTALDVALAKPDPQVDQLLATAADARSAVSQAEDVLDGLLSLTQAQHLDHAREAVDLSAVAEDVLDDRRGAAVAFSVALHPAPVLGDRAMLERLVANLIDNAVKHNAPDGAPGAHGRFVSVATNVSGTHSVVVVENSGARLREDQVAQMLAPFNRAGGRAKTGESGLGLGLTIANAIAVAHGGQLTLTPRDGGGLCVTAALPADVGLMSSPFS
jgi:signal transduction histidine kinase